jgi:hypothetical protein
MICTSDTSSACGSQASCPLLRPHAVRSRLSSYPPTRAWCWSRTRWSGGHRARRPRRADGAGGGGGNPFARVAAVRVSPRMCAPAAAGTCAAARSSATSWDAKTRQGRCVSRALGFEVIRLPRERAARVEMPSRAVRGGPALMLGRLLHVVRGAQGLRAGAHGHADGGAAAAGGARLPCVAVYLEPQAAKFRAGFGGHVHVSGLGMYFSLEPHQQKTCISCD